MQGYQGKNEGLQVLNQIVKYSQPFGISRFCNIHQGSNFGCLFILSFSVAVINDWIVIWEKTYFEWDMLIAHSDLQFLAPILVLLWPLAVVFPFETSARCPLSLGGERLDILHDLTLLNDPLDLRYHEWTNTHYDRARGQIGTAVYQKAERTFFPD